MLEIIGLGAAHRGHYLIIYIARISTCNRLKLNAYSLARLDLSSGDGIADDAWCGNCTIVQRHFSPQPLSVRSAGLNWVAPAYIPARATPAPAWRRSSCPPRSPARHSPAPI